MTADTTAESSTNVLDDPLTVESQAELNDLLDEYDVVLVEFYADWCGPCQMLAPAIDRLAVETDATIATVDVEANQELAGAYGVRGVPTLALFANGQQVESVVGVQPEDRLRSLIEAYTE
ncbi:thioredoxin [Natronorarus salvus]|uniref:thioredoxin n=1 Tax=Natronorarus salvus TaxID=3117733 RepID=UPI002F2619B5